jgi:hypothetical protein
MPEIREIRVIRNRGGDKPVVQYQKESMFSHCCSLREPTHGASNLVLSGQVTRSG